MKLTPKEIAATVVDREMINDILSDLVVEEDMTTRFQVSIDMKILTSIFEEVLVNVLEENERLKRLVTDMETEAVEARQAYREVCAELDELTEAFSDNEIAYAELEDEYNNQVDIIVHLMETIRESAR